MFEVKRSPKKLKKQHIGAVQEALKDFVESGSLDSNFKSQVITSYVA